MNAISKRVIAAAAVVACLAAAFWIGIVTAWGRGSSFAAAPSQPQDMQQAATIYTCAMHTQIRQPRPGKCPICGMDLIPVPTGEDTSSPRLYVTTTEAARLMEIETAPVERRMLDTEVRLTGKVAYDETKLAYLTARVPGRLDKVYVDFTGVSVKMGEPMVDIYSPELIAAQEELLAAKRAMSREDASEGVREVAQITLAAAREKLILWGITEEQVAAMEKRGTPSNTVTLHAPAAGVVIRREGQLGLYVQTGTQLYTIVDLSNVWVQLDAYESDLPFLRLGQKAEVTLEALPGERYEGEVAFIDPLVQPMTRTARVRLNVPNPELRLKPEMFVRAVVKASVGDGPVTAIPVTAPLLTGKRAVVYVKTGDGEKPSFEGREVELGPRAGDYYAVASGLSEGEMVVTRGNFKIDSALQIQGKPSMMQPEGGAAVTGHQHGNAAPPPVLPATSESSSPAAMQDTGAPAPFRAQLGQVVEQYMAVSDALASDDLPTAVKSIAGMEMALDKVDMMLLSGPAHEAWMKSLKALREAVSSAEKAQDMESFRAAFEPLSAAMIQAVKRFGAQRALYVIHCPMAFNNRGADWLQENGKTRNPYFGAMMLTCGTVTETLPAADAQPGAHVHE